MKNRCSFVPDHNKEVHNCCAAHDSAYSSKKGTRAKADRELRNCIASTGHPMLAWVYWTGVRLFGWMFYK